MNLWPHQKFALDEIPALLASGERKILLTSPTGGGKTMILCGLIEWAQERGWKAILYTNRKMLVEQLIGVLNEQGIRCGVRAAGYRDERYEAVQVSSLPTERSRTLGKDAKWDIHGNGQQCLVLIDEAHLNGTGAAVEMLERHEAAGHPYVGFTATPLDLGALYTKLVVAGKPSELRACGALVPAHHWGPDEPDMRKFKQNQNGEFSENDIRKAMMSKTIFGRVLEWYRKLNPDQRPSLLFAPGVGESIWFAEQFTEWGIPWAHLDGSNVWLDGELRETSHDLRQEVIARLKDGTIKGISNRFVLREGIDIPQVSHCIIATVFGALKTYLQSVGRVLRKCAGKNLATIQDHGGMWHRHGSANADRVWDLRMTETNVAGMRKQRLQEKKEIEPIRCYRCGLIRAAGPVCPQCGTRFVKRSRPVVQANGECREMVGDIYRPRRVKCFSGTPKDWERAYYQAKNSKTRMTFNQALGFFFYRFHYFPPRDIALMPIDEYDFFLPVADVPSARLIPKS